MYTFIRMLIGKFNKIMYLMNGNKYFISNYNKIIVYTIT